MEGSTDASIKSAGHMVSIGKQNIYIDQYSMKQSDYKQVTIDPNKLAWNIMNYKSKGSTSPDYWQKYKKVK